MTATRTTARRPSRTGPRLRRLWLDRLEDRAVPATFTVTLAGDAGVADPGDPTSKGDIRHVIGLANSNLGDDVIVFDAAITAVSLNSQLSVTEVGAGLLVDGGGKVTLTNVAAAAATSRIFNIAATGAAAVEFKGLTMTGGNTTSGNNGGAILAANTNLILTNCVFDANKTASSGGAVATATALTTLTVNNCTFTNNNAATGGALHTNSSITATVNNSTFTGNKSTGNGGALSNASTGSWTITLTKLTGNQGSSGGAFRIASTPTVVIDGCTISGNTATSSGGGLYLVSTANLTVTNSTISSNTSTSNGGGIVSSAASTIAVTNSTIANNEAKGTSGGGGISIGTSNLTVNNSTIAGNTASNAGGLGGGIRRTGTTGTITLNSTIVADNTAVGAGGQEIHCTNATTVGGGSNLVENVAAGNFTLSGTNVTGLAPLLGALGAKGGPTDTMELLPGSPAFDKGANPLTLANDQRGAGFPRSLGAAPDVGAYEGTSVIPSALATLPDVPPAGATYAATVVYQDETGINTGAIDVNDVRLSGPGFGSPVAPFNASFTGGGTKVTATYEFNPPGGSWDWPDNGKYTLTMQANEVFDTDGPNAVVAGPLGTFKVGLPLPALVVDNDGDTDDGKYGAGELTLREAVNLTNGAVGTPDSISFAGSLNGKTIFVGSELKITDPVTITGPGAGLLTLDSGGAVNVRAFNIVTGTAGDAVSISGLTVQNFSVTGDGGAVNNQNANLTLTGMVLKSNTASTDGGGINLELTGSALSLINSVLDGNIATSGDGAGLNVEVNATVTITNSAIRNNSASGTSGDGGGIMVVGAASTLTVVGSTISGNSSNNSSAAFGGGGVYFNGASTMTLTNSTVANNTTLGGGGGLHMDDNATLNINNSTIVNNTAAFNGGGINLRSGAAVATLTSTIVSGNSGVTGPDVFGNASATVNVEATNLGNSSGITKLNQTGINFLDVDPLVAALANNGGFTLPDGSVIETVALQPGSPVLNQGINPLSLTFDQRGTGFPRSLGPTDIGAFELKSPIPSGKATAPDVPPALGTVTVSVDYQDDVAINTTSIDTADVTLSGPAFASPVSPVSAGFTGSGTNVTATYTFNAPGGGWQWFHNGKYTVAMAANQVFDTDGPNAVPAGNIGSFKVGQPLPPTLVVDNDGDTDDGKYTAGELTLREAVNLANGETGTANAIGFAGSMNGKTITLGSVLTVSDPLTITGPGAANLTVSGGGATRLFNINIPGAGGDFSVLGLTLANGNATTGTGGAMSIADESVTLNGMVFSSNSITGTGGAIGITGTATVTVNNSTFTGNTASTTGGAINAASTVTLNIADSTFSTNQGTTGGAIRVIGSTSTVTIDRSTLSGNTSSASGGALYVSGSTLAVGYSTFSGNIAGTSGGAVGMSSTAATFTNSTVSGNFANGTGTTGGGGLSITTGSLTLNNSTVTGNAAPTGAGGGVRKTSTTGAVTLSSTILAANTSSAGGADFNLTVAGPINIAGGDNVVGVADTGNFTLSGTNATGTAGAPLDPLLAGLANNGGPTETHALLAGSPAFSTGNNALALANDQRGPGFARTQGAGTDAGAFEGSTVIPSAKATAPNVPPALSTVTVTTVYSDETAINTSSIDVNDVRLTGPAFGTPAAPVSASFSGSGTSVTATYVFDAPAGGWIGTQNGTYQIVMQANQVFDTDGPNAVPAGNIGSFKVGVPLPPLLVDNDADTDDGKYGAGELTLREAVNLSNGVVGTTDQISFAASLNGKTILLGTELDITDALVITGPGATKLTIDGGSLVRHFDVNIPGTGNTFTVSGLTLTNGKAATGSVILATDDAVTVTGCVITNSASTAGNDSAPVLVNATGGSLTIDDCWFDGNSAPGGGAVGVAGGANLLVTDSLFTNNTTTSGNSGGAVRANSTGSAVIRNSTFVGNKAGFNGGGIGFGSLFTGIGLVQNCTVTGNFGDFDDNNAGLNGGGVAINDASPGGSVIIESSIVYGNFDGTVTPSDIFGTDPITANFSLIGTSAGATNFTPDATTTALLGQDPLLGPLANNGGPTQTMELLAGSPAVNKGSNPATLANDQRGPGFARVVGTAADIGAFEMVPPALAPGGFKVNGGGTQRSMVKSLVIDFTIPVSFPGGIAAAFQLNRVGQPTGGPSQSAPLGAVNITAVQTLPNRVTITFAAGGTVPLDLAGSLIDGRYDLTIVATNITGSGFFDGDGDGNGGDDRTENFHRMFGDADGDADVDAINYGSFRAAFGTADPTFDYDGDGDVDSIDYGQFRQRFGSSV